MVYRLAEPQAQKQSEQSQRSESVNNVLFSQP